MQKIALFALIISAVFGLFFQCKSNKYTADQLPAEQLRFGKGGGFAGAEKGYVLLQNGQLFQINLAGSVTELKGVKKKIAKGYYATSETLMLSKLNFYHPGNIYSFIEVPGEKGFHRVAWGDDKFPIDGAVADLHRNLMALLPKEHNN
jgi:hypothetical protein